MIQTLSSTSHTSAAVQANYPCPVCGSANRTDFFQVHDIPVHVGVLWDKEEQARRAPVGDITLAYCDDCGLVQNRALDASKLVFEPGYEVALHHSQVFRDFTNDVASRLVDKYQVRNKEVLEVGCGCGYFLRRLCDLGHNDGVGIDPTVASEGIEQREYGTLNFIRDYFTDRYSTIECDLICCLSVFEDIADPVAFVQRVRRIALRRERVPVYFEVFNGFRALANRESWSIHYEQCNYFSLDSLTNIFKRCGFNILDAGTCYQGDQYLYVEAMIGDQSASLGQSDATDQGALPDVIREFSSHHQSGLAAWKKRFSEFATGRKKVVVWGSGGKGISFLNSLDTYGTVQYVVDINPDRQGKFVPGSAQKIVAPNFLVDYRPDAIILTNVLYEREIKQQVKELGLTCEFFVA